MIFLTGLFKKFWRDQMTKYFIFRNQTNGAQKNEPGSREEMACEIASVISQNSSPKNSYLAFPQENKHTVFETLREMATCTVEIDDEREKIWINEAQGLCEKFGEVEDQIEEAYANLYGSAQDLRDALEETDHFQDMDYLGPKSVERTFENIDSSGMTEFTTRLEELFEVEFFHHQEA